MGILNTQFPYPSYLMSIKLLMSLVLESRRIHWYSSSLGKWMNNCHPYEEMNTMTMIIVIYLLKSYKYLHWYIMHRNMTVVHRYFDAYLSLFWWNVNYKSVDEISSSYLTNYIASYPFISILTFIYEYFIWPFWSSI